MKKGRFSVKKLIPLLLAIAFFAIGAPAVFQQVPLLASGGLNYDSTNFYNNLNIPEYSGYPAVVVNGNEPFLSSSLNITTPFEIYSPLDKLGRCGVTYANICKDIMPTELRQEIGHVRPTGFHTVKYPELIEERYLYNRCHLIAFSLAGENDNVKNLITGTRYFNSTGMAPYEDIVRSYVRNTGNHVLYRVTPLFLGDELVARGVLMEARSVEDNGVKYCVFIYNVQPGIEINYSNGDNWVKK